MTAYRLGPNAIRRTAALLWLWASLLASQCFANDPCPQPRFTEKAPEEYLARTNPVAATTDSISAGETLFKSNLRGAACAACHGQKGDGRGQLSSMFKPPPRDFTCARTVKDIPAGQLFWVVKFGSPGTAMPPNRHLSDEDVWRIVVYIQALVKG